MYEPPKLPSINLTDPYMGYFGYPSMTPRPTTLQTATIYASMGLSSIGNILTSYQQASAMRVKGEYESTIARTNAAIARIQARQVLEAGDTLAARKNLQTRATVGTVRAIQGASGIDVRSPSSVLTRAAIRQAGEMDELTIKTNAARKAWGLETDAMESTYKGEVAQRTGRNEAEQTLLSGGLSALSGPFNIYRRSKLYGSGVTINRLPFDMG